MGEPILCYGKSGSGKSRSLKNFGEDEILFINTISKRLPFPKKFKYELRTKNYALIKDKLMKIAKMIKNAEPQLNEQQGFESVEDLFADMGIDIDNV